MQVHKTDFYTHLNKYAALNEKQIGCKQINHDSIYYPFDDKGTYAPIAEIRLEKLELTELNGKQCAVRHYYILDTIDKKPKKVKI